MQIESSTFTTTYASPARRSGYSGREAEEDRPGVGVRPEDRFELSVAARALQAPERLFGAAKSLPGQGETGGRAKVEQLLSERSAFCPNCGTQNEVLQKGEDAPELIGIEPATGLQEPDGAAEAEGESGAEGNPGPGQELSPEDQEEVKRLEERDREVRTHEQAHVAAGGQYVRGGISYEYENGPNGRRYATGGEVQIDTSPVSGDPEATIRKAQTIRRAALAPAEPSGQDRRAAAAASQMEAEARQEMVKEKMAGGVEKTKDHGGSMETEGVLDPQPVQAGGGAGGIASEGLIETEGAIPKAASVSTARLDYGARRSAPGQFVDLYR